MIVSAVRAAFVGSSIAEPIRWFPLYLIAGLICTSSARILHHFCLPLRLTIAFETTSLHSVMEPTVDMHPNSLWMNFIEGKMQNFRSALYEFLPRRQRSIACRYCAAVYLLLSGLLAIKSNWLDKNSTRFD